MLKRNGFIKTQIFLKPMGTQLNLYRSKRAVDASKVPIIQENDLEEKFIKGGGPGGQKVNKSVNCVYLLHKPSGLSVKVHDSRDQAQNRIIARKRLVTLLDNLTNKDESIENQKKQILKEKSAKMAQKQRKLVEKKIKWKQLISEIIK